MCRRAHGAAYVTWFGVERERLRLTAGAEALSRYASSPQATRAFCSRCGSMLFFESSRWPDEVHVTLASLHGELDHAPAAHVFFDDRARWVAIGDRLPRRGGPTGTAAPAPSALEAATRGCDPRLRLATAADAEALARLHGELAAVAWDTVGEAMGPEDMGRHIARFLAAHHESVIILAEEDGRAVGMAVVHPFPALAEGTTQLVLDDIYVEAPARRRGIGSALMDATLAAARALEAPIVHLSVRPDNAAARRLYEKHGFRAAADVPYVWEA
jgi:ribosomal protein S18 acetylase RimI-like enzyme